jgi:hypothetical protein
MFDQNKTISHVFRQELWLKFDSFQKQSLDRQLVSCMVLDNSNFIRCATSEVLPFIRGRKNKAISLIDGEVNNLNRSIWIYYFGNTFDFLEA